MYNQIENAVIFLLTGLEIKGKDQWHINRNSPIWREAYGIIKGYLICTTNIESMELITCKAIELMVEVEMKTILKKTSSEIKSCISS